MQPLTANAFHQRCIGPDLLPTFAIPTHSHSLDVSIHPFPNKSSPPELSLDAIFHVASLQPLRFA